MKRLLLILSFVICSTWAFAQDDTRVVDSLENVLTTQQGSERIRTMIQMVWAFYDVSFDDGMAWGEKAIQLSHETGDVGLEAEASYAMGVQYGYHNDLDLAQDYLKKAYDLFEQDGNETKAFDALWNQAYFEMLLGNVDTACSRFQKLLVMAERRHDDLACAQVHANLAVVYYQQNDFNRSIEALKASRGYYELLKDSTALVQAEFNLATLYGDFGKTEEARGLYQAVIPKLETYEMYDVLLLAYKNYGQLFEHDHVNYDSANYYLKKALAITELDGISRQDRQTMANSKADVLTELGNVAIGQEEYQLALNYYEEALSLAENNNYHLGQMQAMLGLGQLYAKQGEASLSLHYLESYSDEAARSGITMIEHAVRKPLIMDYARLGRFAEMEKELDELDEQRASLSRENADLYEQSRLLDDELKGLLQQYDSQNKQIATLQTQRDQYRLAFFGLLAIALFMVVLFAVYKIVRKNRVKNVKS